MKAILHSWIGLRWTDVILGLTIGDPAPPIHTRAPITVEAVSAEAQDTLTGLPDPRSRQVLRARWHRGDVCLVARQSHRIISFAWLTKGPWHLRDANLRVDLAPTDGIIYDFFTDPAFRGQGVMQATIRAAADLARQRGYRRIYARAERANAGSIAAMERVGFRQIATITTTRWAVFFGWYTVTIADGERAFLRLARRGIWPLRLGVLRWHGGGEHGTRVRWALPAPRV